MKRLLVSIVVSVLLLWGSPLLGGVAQADSALFTVSDQMLLAGVDPLQQLEMEVLPQLETILYPEQLESFQAAIADGKNFRKAFKSIALTAEQKSQLAAVFKEMPKRDIFATLTPEQKKELFLKKKDFFRPSAEEITERIRAGMEMKGTTGEGSEFAPSLDTISEKINQGLQMRDKFAPSLEDIQAKITEKLESVTVGE